MQHFDNMSCSIIFKTVEVKSKLFSVKTVLQDFFHNPLKNVYTLRFSVSVLEYQL